MFALMKDRGHGRGVAAAVDEGSQAITALYTICHSSAQTYANPRPSRVNLSLLVNTKASANNALGKRKRNA